MDHLSATFAALADPTRRAILARLALGETTVTELAAPFEMTLPAVTKHLKVLERAGLVIRGREAQWRPCRLEAKPLQQAVGWIEQYRKFWEERLDRLEDYLRELQAQEEAETPAKKASKKPVAKAQKDGKNSKEAATGGAQNAKPTSRSSKPGRQK
ncbi:MAG: metalloregulator ArsR/SmtB family transcription factor [Moraxellaceae bacterium]